MSKSKFQVTQPGQKSERTARRRQAQAALRKELAEIAFQGLTRSTNLTSTAERKKVREQFHKLWLELTEHEFKELIAKLSEPTPG